MPVFAVSLAFALGLLPSVSVYAAPGGLSAAAAASGRPPECSTGSHRSLGRGASVWERARVPNLELYCDLVAHAQAELSTRPEVAQQKANEADHALPGHAAPHVVLGRALLGLGMPGEALAAFERAKAIDPRSVEEPVALHAYARILIRNGKRAEALGVYRTLVPRAELLGSPAERAVVLIEASDASMVDAGATSGSTKPARLDEAIAYLREAKLRPSAELAGDVGLALALALDRSGAHAEADAELTEASRAGARPHSLALAFLAAPEDVTALEAIAAEAIDRTEAQTKWEAFLSGPGGKTAWAGAARSRLDALKRGGGHAPTKARRPP